MLCLLPGQFALGLRYVDQLMLQSFDVSLTVHLSITLANDQLDTQFFFLIYYSNFRQLNCFQSDDTRCCINTI